MLINITTSIDPDSATGSFEPPEIKCYCRCAAAIGTLGNFNAMPVRLSKVSAPSVTASDVFVLRFENISADEVERAAGFAVWCV
jgi:hypothetical protein